VTVRTPPTASPFEDSLAGPHITPAGKVTEPLPRIRGYRIEREIARGGMGTVYLAVQ